MAITENRKKAPLAIKNCLFGVGRTPTPARRKYKASVLMSTITHEKTWVRVASSAQSRQESSFSARAALKINASPTETARSKSTHKSESRLGARRFQRAVSARVVFLGKGRLEDQCVPPRLHDRNQHISRRATWVRVASSAQSRQE